MNSQLYSATNCLCHRIYIQHLTQENIQRCSFKAGVVGELRSNYIEFVSYWEKNCSRITSNIFFQLFKVFGKCWQCRNGPNITLTQLRNNVLIQVTFKIECIFRFQIFGIFISSTFKNYYHSIFTLIDLKSVKNKLKNNSICFYFDLKKILKH